MIRLPPRSTRTDTLFPYTTLFRSTGEVVCLRNGLEFALRRVAPGVIGTYEAARCTAGICDQRRATMLANITESSNYVVRATTDDDRKYQLLKQLVRTLLGQFAHMRRAQPGLAKDVLHFKVVEVLVMVTSRRHLWQRRQILRVCRALDFAFHRFIEKDVAILAFHASAPKDIDLAPVPNRKRQVVHPSDRTSVV